MSESGFVVAPEVKRLLEDAYVAAKHALDLLDEASAPAHIGAHFDHGLSEIKVLLTGLEPRRG